MIVLKQDYHLRVVADGGIGKVQQRNYGIDRPDVSEEDVWYTVLEFNMGDAAAAFNRHKSREVEEPQVEKKSGFSVPGLLSSVLKVNRGHDIEYFEMAAGYQAKCARCGKRSSYMPGFSKWWEGETCPGEQEVKQ